MNKAVASWKSVQLSDIATVIAGQSPEGRFYNQTGTGVPFLQGSAEFGAIHPVNTLHTTHVTKIAPQGAILFSVRAPVAELNIADQSYCIGRGLAAIVSKPQTNRDFLYQLLLFNTSRFRLLSQGSTFESITTEQLKSIHLVVPSTLSDQSAIAEVLKHADNLIARTEETITKHERIRAGLLHDLLTRGVDERGCLRSEETHEFKDSPIGRIPVEWETGPLSLVAYVNPSTSTKKLKAESLCSFVGMEDVDNNAKLTNKTERAFSQVRNGFTKFATNDVLFAKITPCMENGKGALATSLIADIGFGSTEFHVLRAKNTQSIQFAYYWSTNPRLRLAAKNQMVGSAGQQRVPTLFFDRYLIGIPPVDERGRIGEIMVRTDEKLSQYEQILLKYRRVKTGLLHDLLTPPQTDATVQVAQEAEAIPA